MFLESRLTKLDTNMYLSWENYDYSYMNDSILIQFRKQQGPFLKITWLHGEKI